MRPWRAILLFGLGAGSALLLTSWLHDAAPPPPPKPGPRFLPPPSPPRLLSGLRPYRGAVAMRQPAADTIDIGPAVFTTTTQPTPASAITAALERFAFAVEGAESSWGTDRRMWRVDPLGPQGPMQVSFAASLDVGGEDRFDPASNRAIGRAYLLHLYQRYGDWPDAVAAYNWGPGHLDQWIAAGRPGAVLPPQLTAYVGRVLTSPASAAADSGAASAGAAPSGTTASVVAASDVSAAVVAPVDASTIGNAARRNSVLHNQALIAELRDIEAGGPPQVPERQSRFAAILRELARRKGYEEFGRLASASQAATVSALRSIGTVLASKLQAEDAAIALIDRHPDAEAPSLPAKHRQHPSAKKEAPPVQRASAAVADAVVDAAWPAAKGGR